MRAKPRVLNQLMIVSTDVFVVVAHAVNVVTESCRVEAVTNVSVIETGHGVDVGHRDRI